MPRKVSVVVPVYNEEANLPRLLPRLLPVLAGLGRPCEVVFADDGSRDRSLEILKTAAAAKPGNRQGRRARPERGAAHGDPRGLHGDGRRIRHHARRGSPEPARGDPEGRRRRWTPATTSSGRSARTARTRFFRRAASRLVNRTTAAITGMKLNDYGCMLRGYHRDVVDVMSASDEASTFIPALAQQYARRPVEIPVAHAERTAGESKYSLYKLVRLNFDLMTGFSVVPLQLFGLLGFVTAVSGVGFGVFLLVRRFVVGAEAEGVFTLFALAFVVMGVLMAGIGIVGEYVGRIYQQVRGRPRFLIRKVWGATDGRDRRLRVLRRRIQVPRSALRPGRERARRLHARRRAGRGALVRFGRRAGAHERHRAAARSRPGRPCSTRSASAPWRPIFSSRSTSEKMIPETRPRARAARSTQHARFAPARVPRPLAGELGHSQGRDGDGRLAPLHDGEAGRRRPRGSGARADRPRGRRSWPCRAAWRTRPRTVLARALPSLKAGDAPRVPLDLSKGCYFGGRKPEDGHIDWTRSAKEIHDLVRAVTKPWPGAFTDVFGKKVTIWKTRLSPHGGHDVFPGKVELTEHSVIVYAGDDHTVEILAARPEGGTDLDAAGDSTPGF